MKILGFHLTKISAEKMNNFKTSKIIPNIDFTKLEKDTAELLKESEVLKVSFKHSLSYKNPESKEEYGHISFNGLILLSVTQEESKKMMKSWKKKNFPEELKLSLSNVILRRCTSKALQLQDELNLPTHIPMPILDKKN